MGLGIGVSRCSCGDNTSVRTVERVVERVVQVPEGNPVPTNFRVIKTLTHGQYVVAMVRYPDARNYEGLKIMVYKGVTPNDLAKASFLDPHFCESKAHISPLARFEPTEEGWRMAVRFTRSLP